MISIKGGTKTWSDSAQNTAQNSLSQQQKTISAEEAQKYFGDQSLGDIANKVADPNWVDPAKKARTAGNSQLDRDAFLKLLLTQMKNQDPTTPMKSHEMAAQLAQFTSLEKLTNINDGIESLRKDTKPSQNFEALNLIGKSITVDGSKILRSDETDFHDVKFSLSGTPTKVDVNVKDAAGNIVRQLSFNGLKEGENMISWNGMLEDGSKAPKGNYQVEIKAQASNGNKIFAELKREGQITGVNFSADGPVLMMGNKEVPLSDVKQIVDPRLTRPQAQPLKAGQVANPNQVNVGQESPQAKNKPVVKPESKPEKVVLPSNIGDVAMSRGMQQTLEKDGIDAGL